MRQAAYRYHDRTAFYKYMSAARAKTVLATRQLRWSSPLLFNDPFDVTQELRLNFDEAKLSALINERLATLLEEGNISMVKHPALVVVYGVLGRLPPDRRKAMANTLRASPEPPTRGQVAALAELRGKWRELVPAFRILCLSELNNVTPMWQHYSDGHKGVVLEFTPSYSDSPFLVARPVVYQDDPPAIADPRADA
jgi:hypothetical protein